MQRRHSVTPVILCLVLAATACNHASYDVADNLPGSDETAGETGLADAVSKSYSGTLLDFVLRAKLIYADVYPVAPPQAKQPALVELGRNLFFDQELAGRRNIACSTCHHPVLGSADGQSQSRGQGTVGLGPARRQDGDAFFEFLPRNALSLWNRGVDEWNVMFWDGRLGGTPDDGFFSPAGADTPQTFSHALALFSIFPITPDQEMRGFTDQTVDVLGNPNELAGLANSDFVDIWDGVTARIVANDGYDDLLADAFPGVPESDISIVELGEAMGAFMAEGFTALNSPFDRYLAGDNSALSNEAKRGAVLFYGRANCSNCHSGGLTTDLDFHNIAAPQVGGGNLPEAPLDFGRGRITGLTSDNFKFRTPALRNIALEAPYFHNGAYDTLEGAVRHHLDPATALANYDESQVEPELIGTFVDDPAVINTLLTTIDPLLGVSGPPLTDGEVSDLLAFLHSLTDPASTNLRDLIPFNLPSGLSLAD